MESEIESVRHLADGFIRESFELGELKIRPVTAGTGLVVDLMLSSFSGQLNRLSDEKPAASEVNPDQVSPREQYSQMLYACILLYCLTAPIAEVTTVSLDPDKTRETILVFMQQEYFQPARIAETFKTVNAIGLHAKTGEVTGDGEGKTQGTNQ